MSETNSQSLLIVNKECRSSIRTVLLQQFRSGTEEYRERADARGPHQKIDTDTPNAVVGEAVHKIGSNADVTELILHTTIDDSSR